MQKHYIVGTAGHIDHGKTTLSKALTGKDTDRLKEEKQRNISIELGFAPFTLPNGDQVSLIDVPGHEKFVRHMVAGVGGIDLVLLVIAADEGVMPQTEEHLNIIQLLGIEHGIVVLTKKDLVDEEFIELVEEDIRELLSKTSLKNAPILSVSSKNNEGIEVLKKTIQEELSKIPERSSTGFLRMPIDRVFTLKGIGTVVTGTVYSGIIHVGDELEILPSNFKVRVRSLQVHSESVETAYAGQRVAVNIAGVELEDIQRGDSLVTINQWEPSNRVDIELHILEDLDFPLKQNNKIKFHVGTSEVLGSIVLYDRKEAVAGETIYCQVKLEESIISSRKERFIIRRPSPATTIAGGIIIDPNADKHKFRKETVDHLKQISKGTLKDLIYQQLLHNSQIFLTSSELSNILTLPEKEISEAIQTLIEEEKIVAFTNSKPILYSSHFHLENLQQRITKYLLDYHQEFPLRTGVTKAEFLSIFTPQLKPKLAQNILSFWESQQFIKINEEFISAYDFAPQLPSELQKVANQIEELLINQGFAPEDWDDIALKYSLSQKDKLELYNFLLSQNKIVKLTDKIVIHFKIFLQAKELITAYLMKEKQLTLQEAKEILQVSRKYLIPLMEAMDREKVTVLRQGQNYRELRKVN